MLDLYVRAHAHWPNVVQTDLNFVVVVVVFAVVAVVVIFVLTMKLCSTDRVSAFQIGGFPFIRVSERWGTD